MRFDKRAKILSLAGVAAVAIGVGVGSTVPTEVAGVQNGDPKLASLMHARSPGMRTNAALSSKEPIVRPAVFTPTMAPAAQAMGERSPALVPAAAAVAPGAAPLAPAVLAPSAVPAIAPAVGAAAVPIVAVPVAVGVGGGGSALAGLAALPIIPALLSGGGGGGGGVSVAPAVPEPATWLMMIIGFGVIGSALRRGRRREQEDGLAPSRDLNSLAQPA